MSLVLHLRGSIRFWGGVNSVQDFLSTWNDLGNPYFSVMLRESNHVRQLSSTASRSLSLWATQDAAADHVSGHQFTGVSQALQGGYASLIISQVYDLQSEWILQIT